VANCGYSAAIRGNVAPGRTTTATRRAYVLQHEQFHRDLNEKYQRLASRRSADLLYRLRLREQEQAEHARWHERVGIRH
jgi:hypothetical protein